SPPQIRRAVASTPPRPPRAGRPAAGSSGRQDVDGAAMQGEAPVPIALDLEDLVDEARYLDFQIVVALRGRARLVEPDVERPGDTQVDLTHDGPGHEVHVMRGLDRIAVLADQAH